MLSQSFRPTADTPHKRLLFPHDNPRQRFHQPACNSFSYNPVIWFGASIFIACFYRHSCIGNYNLDRTPPSLYFKFTSADRFQPLRTLPDHVAYTFYILEFFIIRLPAALQKQAYIRNFHRRTLPAARLLLFPQL